MPFLKAKENLRLVMIMVNIGSIIIPLQGDDNDANSSTYNNYDNNGATTELKENHAYNPK